MISYISGVVEEIEKDKVVVDNNGIGYGIFASQSTLEQIGIGEQVKIYTYFSVREDAMQLYGFLSRQELQLFKLLIGVSGVAQPPLLPKLLKLLRWNLYPGFHLKIFYHSL